MSRCFVFGALPVDLLPIRPCEEDYLIAADKGLEHMKALGLVPHLIVGDFDSLGYTPQENNLVRLNVRKDDTDTAHAMDHAWNQGYRDFIVYGGIGGRLEHTIANIQIAHNFAKRGARVRFIGEREMLEVVCSGTIHFPKEMDGRISVFAIGGAAHGVTIRGLSYEVSKVTLCADNPLGVSNEFVGKESCIAVEDGSLLVIWDMPNTTV